MTTLADKIPAMTDADLNSLRANATRLAETGASTQVMAAADILPIIDAEVARRAALPKAAKAPVKRAAPKKKLPPVTGHQTALPSS
ncbi:hypothetical protein GCM10017620_34310 [Brevundimonas intermedia]|jgi:hypothetical protein|uniref:Uncharacterized protein n=1 Tax=Brevundimonas intermedia TaxID=74315 RepID=A0ABQ5TEP3_9CAUL|nr:hypothetical protein [Brevundimonas intermedia]GLK50457.1 hypothetical protein GCM10017620_34310 [Brevundimonas intermedia]